MLKLAKKTDYAIIILTHLGEAKAPVSARKVAWNYQLPYPMVANLLKMLVSSGLIKSSRGQHGGYVLAVPADKILLSEIEIECSGKNIKSIKFARGIKSEKT